MVRLKHPKKDLYIGGEDFYPKFVEKEVSEVFFDKKSIEIGKIIIPIKENRNKVWDIEAWGSSLIFYPEHGKRNQRFKVIFIARDVIVIKSALGKCITYNEIRGRFFRKSCKPNKKYANQIFLITDEKFNWDGTGTSDSGWGAKDEKDIPWGKCQKCIRGGFGTIEQGIEFDRIKQKSFKANKNYSKYHPVRGNLNFGGFAPFFTSVRNFPYRSFYSDNNDPPISFH